MSAVCLPSTKRNEIVLGFRDMQDILQLDTIYVAGAVWFQDDSPPSTCMSGFLPDPTNSYIVYLLVCCKNISAVCNMRSCCRIWNCLLLSLGVYQVWWDRWWEEAMKGLGLATMGWCNHWWDQWLMGSILGPAIRVWWDPWWRLAIDVLMDISTVWSDHWCLMYDILPMYSLWLGLLSVCI